MLHIVCEVTISVQQATVRSSRTPSHPSRLINVTKYLSGLGYYQALLARPQERISREAECASGLLSVVCFIRLQTEGLIRKKETDLHFRSVGDVDQ